MQKKILSELSLSSNDSYQSLSDLTIECCICLEEYENKNSFMPDCLHSWCKDCNDKLNKEHINQCPICKQPFKSILRKGRWVFQRNGIIGQWKWEKGFEDSSRKLRKKKIQSIFINFWAYLPNGEYSIGGISV